VRAQRAGQSALLLLDAAEVLVRERVEYVVIGAFALAALGKVRGTTDADVLLSATHKRLMTLRDLFEAAGFNVTLRQGDVEDPIPSLLILSDEHANQVELLGGLKGLDLQVFQRGFDISFHEQPLRIVGREDFVAMKCFAGGPQDLLDAMAAYQLAPGPLDLDLLRMITRRFGRDAADKLEQVLASV
jgi:hypothetical protein